MRHSRLDNDTPASVQICRICARYHQCRHARRPHIGRISRG